MHLENRIGPLTIFSGMAGLLPVRLAIYLASVVITVIAATALTRLFVPAAPSPLHQMGMVKNLLLPMAELCVYAWVVRRMEQRPANEILFGRDAGRLFGVGFIRGMALIAAVIATLWLSGVATIRAGTGMEGLASEIVVPFTTATIEELIFRAILFRLIEAMLGTTMGVLLSCALFALAHLGNTGANGTTTIFLAFDLGLLLTVAFAASRSLWLSIGLHMGWNLALGYAFGVANSGAVDPHSAFRTTLMGSIWLSGGLFGLESSVVTLAFAFLSSGVLLAVDLRKGYWQPLSFHLLAKTT